MLETRQRAGFGCGRSFADSYLDGHIKSCPHFSRLSSNDPRGVSWCWSQDDTAAGTPPEKKGCLGEYWRDGAIAPASKWLALSEDLLQDLLRHPFLPGSQAWIIFPNVRPPVCAAWVAGVPWSSLLCFVTAPPPFFSSPLCALGADH